MDERLRPLNALLGLVLPHGLYPAVLKDAGFDLVGLEVPVRTDLGNVVIDVLLHHPPTNLLLACEVKSGANVELPQARSYGAIDPIALVQAAQVTVRQLTGPTVAVLYVCLAEHLDRIKFGLAAAEVDAAVLAFSATDAFLHPNDEPAPPLDGLVWPISIVAPPPVVVPFDHDSDDAEVKPTVQAELVAALAHRRVQVGMRWLSEQAAPYSSLLGRQARTNLVRKVERVARELAAETPETFVFVPALGNENEAVVRILRTPEDNDPRGRTQAYQALTRSGSRRPRTSRRSNPDQLDLLKLVETGDDGEPGGTDEQGEEDDR